MITTTSTAEKAERHKAFGASEVINYIETPNRDEKPRELTGGNLVNSDCACRVAKRRCAGRWWGFRSETDEP